MKRITALTMALILMLSMLLVSADASAETLTGTVKGGWLILRQSPSTASAALDRCYTGTTVTILGTSGSSWYHVQIPTGKTGYMMSKYITVNSSGTGSAGSLNIPAWVTSQNGQSVRLRSGPSTNYATLGYYPVGTAVTILSKGTYWFQVNIAGTTGYMMSQFLTTTAPGSSVVPPPSSSGSYTGWVTSQNGKSVNLRSGAGTGYSVLGQYSVGTEVTVLSHGATWDYIRVGTRTGYMMTEFITRTKPGTPVAPPSSGSYTAYVTSANGLSVRMRTGAGTGYSVLYNLPVGTQVTVLSHGATWDRIRYNTTDGYMMTQYLTTIKPGTAPVPPASPSSYTAYVTSGNGKSVNLRSGAGTGYTSLIQLAVGTPVTVTGSTGSWSMVTYGSYSGYMMTQYLTTSAPSVPSVPSTGTVVTGVTLNTYAPAVGGVLVASVIPNDASVNYAWIDGNGTVVGADSSYRVKSTDVGKILAVRVTGKGKWTGNASSGYTSAVTASASKTVLTGVTISGKAVVGKTLTAQAQPADATASYIWYRLSDGAMVGSGATYKPSAADAGSALFCTAVGSGNYTGAVNSAHTAVITQPDSGDIRLSGTVTLPATTEVGRTLVPDVNLNTNEYAFYWMVNGTVHSTANRLRVSQGMAGKTITLKVEAIPGTGYKGSVTSGECQVKVPQVTTPTDFWR